MLCWLLRNAQGTFPDSVLPPHPICVGVFLALTSVLPSAQLGMCLSAPPWLPSSVKTDISFSPDSPITTVCFHFYCVP